MRLALWHEGGLGDVIDAAHFAIAIRRSRSDIDYFCLYLRNPVQNDLVFSLVYDNKPVFDGTIQTDIRWSECVESEARRWDSFIDWRPYVAVEYQTSFLDELGETRIHTPVFHQMPDEWRDCYRHLLTSPYINLLQRWQMSLHDIACKSLDIEPASIGLMDVNIDAPVRWQVRLAARGNYITLGSGSDAQQNKRVKQTKEWPDSKWEQVVRGLRKEFPRLRILQVGKQGESHIPGTVSMLGRTSIPEVLWLLKHSQLNLSCENGTARMAAAAGTRSVVVCGPTSHHVYGMEGNVNIYSDACEPCYWRGDKWMVECPNDWGVICLASIPASRVIDEAATLLRNEKDSPNA